MFKKQNFLAEARLFSEIFLNPYKIKIRSFKPKIKIYFEKNNYIVKTASNFKEFKEVLKLRFNVFYKEYMNKNPRFGIDLDKYDFQSDHLMVINKETGKCVGTYRLICSKFSKKFYSNSEFFIKNFSRLPGVKLELGRACIDPNARNGATILLLYRGINEYIKESGSDFLFGCSSIKTMDYTNIGMAYKYLLDNYKADESLAVFPRKKYCIKNLDYCINYFNQYPELYDQAKAEKMLPTLLKFYLHSGAKISGEPALDKYFKCVDFFTILNLQTSSAAIKKKYNNM